MSFATNGFRFKCSSLKYRALGTYDYRPLRSLYPSQTMIVDWIFNLLAKNLLKQNLRYNGTLTYNRNSRFWLGNRIVHNLKLPTPPTTKIHPYGTQMNPMMRNMMPCIGTEQNMTISTLTRMEIMKIFKLVHLPLTLFGKRSATDTPRKTTKLNTFHTQQASLLFSWDPHKQHTSKNYNHETRQIDNERRSICLCSSVLYLSASRVHHIQHMHCPSSPPPHNICSRIQPCCLMLAHWWIRSPNRSLLQCRWSDTISRRLPMYN